MTRTAKTLLTLSLTATSTMLFACNGDPCLDDGPAKGVCHFDAGDETGGEEADGDEDHGCGETGDGDQGGEAGGDYGSGGDDENPPRCDGGDDEDPPRATTGGDSDSDSDGEQDCTLTQGYWKNHDTWPLPATATMTCGMSWQEILETPPQGDAWTILAHQFIAAELNLANGASAPSEVVSATGVAKEMLAACSIDESDHDEAVDFAAILDAYNNGLIGPGHCE